MYEGHDLKMTKAFGSTELAHKPLELRFFERMNAAQRTQWDAAYS